MVTSDTLHRLLASDEVTHRDKVLLVLASAKGKPVPTTEIFKIAKASGLHEVERWNVHDILLKAGESVIKGNAGWKLSPQGRDQVRRKFVPSGKK